MSFPHRSDGTLIIALLGNLAPINIINALALFGTYLSFGVTLIKSENITLRRSYSRLPRFHRLSWLLLHLQRSLLQVWVSTQFKKYNA